MAFLAGDEAATLTHPELEVRLDVEARAPEMALQRLWAVLDLHAPTGTAAGWMLWDAMGARRPRSWVRDYSRAELGLPPG